MSFWQQSNGETVEASDKFETAGGEPIPEKTVVPSIASEAKWDSYEGERYVNVKFDVVDGQYKGRVVFLKLKFEGTDKQRDRALNLLATMDTITNAGLMKLQNEPSDMELFKICNKPMDIRVMIWKNEDTGNKGNWVQAVAALGALSGSAKQVPVQAAAPASNPSAQEFDDDIPF